MTKITYKMIDDGAKALAWSELTEYGRNNCDWKRDFSLEEHRSYRGKASAVLHAALDVKPPEPIPFPVKLK